MRTRSLGLGSNVKSAPGLFCAWVDFRAVDYGDDKEYYHHCAVLIELEFVQDAEMEHLEGTARNAYFMQRKLEDAFKIKKDARSR